MRPNLGWIRKFHHSEQPLGTRPLIVVFPHAGGGASGYREFSRELHRDFDVVVLQYPARQDRAREAMPPTLAEVAQGAFTEFKASPLANIRPLVLFGHSMGSRIAFEFARLIEGSDAPADLVCVSAALPPCRQHLSPSEPYDDEGIIQRMTLLNGTTGDVMESQELLRLALPTLRGDYAAFNKGNSEPFATLHSPLLIMGGNEDPAVTEDVLRAWAENSNKSSTHRMFPGGHFYWQNHEADVARVIAEVFRQHTDSSDQGARS